jgi:hypothetical protein
LRKEKALIISDFIERKERTGRTLRAVLKRREYFPGLNIENVKTVL